MSAKTFEIERNDKITPNLQFLVAQLNETRNRLLKTVSTIPEDIIHETPNDDIIESIATLLDHIAAIEWSWIFEDIDGKKMDDEEWKYAFATRSWSKVKQRKGKSNCRNGDPESGRRCEPRPHAGSEWSLEL